MGATLPAGGVSEQQLAILVGQRLQLCMPLLARTGVLGVLRLSSDQERRPQVSVPEHQTEAEVEIDPQAQGLITAMGGDSFL